MVFLTGSILLKLFGVLIATLLIAVVYFKRKYSYWKNLGVEYVEPTMPFGNAMDNFFQKMTLGDWYVNFYQTMKARKLKYAGTYFFHVPMFVVFDLDMAKQIIQTDFAHFTDHGAYVNEKDDPLSAHLFSLNGQKWRNLRVKLTPTFTSGKMKMMFPILVKTSQELVATLQKECGNGPIDAKDVSARFTTDVIGNCAFGIDCNSLKDPNTEFRVKGKRLLTLTRTELLLNFLSFLFPNLMKSLGTRLFPKEGTDFFWNVIKDTAEYREKTGYRRSDAMQLLLDMMSKDGTESENTLTFREIAAQAFVFFLAGFETSSTLMSFVLFELSQNEDVQDRLRSEITNTLERNNGELSYEAIWGINYLDMVINGVFVATLLLAIVYFKRKYSYWKNLGVEYVEPTIPFGNATYNFLQKISLGDWYANFYQIMKARKLKYAGSYFFNIPIFVVFELNMVKQIIQTDFAHFTDHGAYVNEKDDPLSAHVFSLTGQRWRNLRVKLTPTFTSGKMKMMFPILVKTSQELVATLQKECGNGPIDAKDVSARFTTDVIGNCAFGLDCNSLRDPSTEFRVKGKRVFNLTRIELLCNFLGFISPNLMRCLGVRLLPKEATDFFWKVIKDTVEYRKKTGYRRNDALQLLLDMMSTDGMESENTLTFREVAAQAFVFFMAGFETSSTLMSFALFELSQNQDVQDRLRSEIGEALERNNGDLTYEAIWEMNYLGMVINETLRKYPPLPILTRQCTKDYRVPDTNIIIHKEDAVFIPIKGIHYDSEYYPDPHKFDPTRFTEENKSKRHPFTFLPFGEGPRICIGMRFGLMQAKVGLASLIANFKFKLNPKTELPVKLDPKNFLTTALCGIWIDVEKIG